MKDEKAESEEGTVDYQRNREGEENKGGGRDTWITRVRVWQL